MGYELRDSEIRHRVSQAQHLGIMPDRLYEYAYLHECALCAVQRDGATQASSIDALYASYGSIYGFGDGANDHKRVEQFYRDSRQKAQSIHATAVSLMARLTDFENLCLRESTALPRDFFKGINLVSGLHGTCDLLYLVMARAASLISLPESGYPGQVDDELAALREGKEYEPDHLLRNLARLNAELPTHSALTLVWWHTGIANYRGKWKDMHGLAIEWKLSTAADIENFRKYLKRLSKRTIFAPAPPVGMPNAAPV